MPGGIVTTSGQIGPIVVSGNYDGSLFMAGWVMVDKHGTFVNYFPQHSNQYNIGTSLFNSKRGLLYTQIPVTKGDAPVLRISDIDNLTVEEQLQLPENTSGKSVLTQRWEYDVLRFRQWHPGASGRITFTNLSPDCLCRGPVLSGKFLQSKVCRRKL